MCVQSRTAGHALMRFLWSVSSVLGFLGPGWPPISLPGLWTQAWNPGEGILGYYLGFKECYLVVGSVLSGFYDPAWSVIKPKTSSKVVD